MKKIYWSISLFLSLIFKVVAYSEIHNICEIREYIDDSTWVVFDIDNTLMEPQEHEGGDIWFSNQVAYWLSLGHDHHEACDKVLPEYFELQYKISVKPVEHSTVELIENLQAKNITVFALTARSEPIIEQTCKLLNSINIDLSKTAPNTDISFNLRHPAFYNNGILFAGKNDKGEVLNCLLQSCSKLPKRIVFVDDKHRYVISVEKAIEKFINANTSLELFAFRYKYLDQKVEESKITYSNNIAAHIQA